MNFEQGLEQLKQLAWTTDCYQEVLLYEARLRENLREEQRYGTHEQVRASRAQIIYQLNCLTLEHFSKSFNDLCQSLVAPLSSIELQETQRKQKEENVPALPLEYWPQSSTAQSVQRARAFIDFSEHDRRFLNELHVHLDQYVQAGTVEYWDNTKILPGAQWQKEMNQALQSTKVAVLLVSASFLADPSPLQQKLFSLLPSAEEGGTRIFCVIVRPCAFEDSPLARFRPVNTKPLSRLSLAKREEVWREVAKLVRDSL
jgi:hypothetical protein